MRAGAAAAAKLGWCSGGWKLTGAPLLQQSAGEQVAGVKLALRGGGLPGTLCSRWWCWSLAAGAGGAAVLGGSGKGCKQAQAWSCGGSQSATSAE